MNIRKHYVRFAAKHPLVTTIFKGVLFIVFLPVIALIVMIVVFSMVFMNKFHEDFIVSYQRWKDDIRNESKRLDG